MDTGEYPEISGAVDRRERRLINPYMDVVGENRPPEIAKFELETDPYRNFLPGISNVNAAKTLGRGLRAGRGGNRVLLVVSLLLIAVLVLPAFAAVFAQLFH